MNINDLTISQARELVRLLGNAEQPKAPHPHPFAGKFVIVRCTAAGVHAGTLISVEGDTVILADSRRLWNWTAKKGVALSGVAQFGVESGASKLDALNPEIFLLGVCEIIPCSDAAKESIQNA